MSQNRIPAGVPTGGQFASEVRAEADVALASADFGAHFGVAVQDPREAYRVVDGQCSNCGHYDDHEFCEYCSPTCTECFAEREDVDRSLCDSCQQKADAYDDDSW